ncbi:unnamed protein product [Rotaria sp. Silwood1]|nr:unnamed protein product [Rotaria sp. Silwood1]CAF4723652.1 unnamed protein product [Rotaria sp. Silwood1]
MGIGNSRTSSGHGSSSGRRRGCFFRRNKPSPTTQINSFGTAQPVSYQRMYGVRPNTRPIPIYPPLDQPSPSFLPLSYNHYHVSSYVPPQPMMIPPRVAAPIMPPSYMVPAPLPPRLPPPPPLPPPIPPVSIPYVQQPQLQPIYNNIPAPVSMPMGISGGAVLNPPSYPGAPPRLITDWTGGGAISPGFLGPPI